MSPETAWWADACNNRTWRAYRLIAHDSTGRCVPCMYAVLSESRDEAMDEVREFYGRDHGLDDTAIEVRETA